MLMDIYLSRLEISEKRNIPRAYFLSVTHGIRSSAPLIEIPLYFKGLVKVDYLAATR